MSFCVLCHLKLRRFLLTALPQALSINPRSLFASLESIEECGITLSEPLRTSDAGDQATDHTLTPGEKHPGLKTRSNSRLALVAKTIGINILTRQNILGSETR